MFVIHIDLFCSVVLVLWCTAYGSVSK